MARPSVLCSLKYQRHVRQCFPPWYDRSEPLEFEFDELFEFEFDEPFELELEELFEFELEELLEFELDELFELELDELLPANCCSLSSGTAWTIPGSPGTVVCGVRGMLFIPPVSILSGCVAACAPPVITTPVAAVIAKASIGPIL